MTLDKRRYFVAISNDCHFQAVADTRTAVSLGVFGAVGTAILATFVVLAVLKTLPVWAYGIGGGAFVGSFGVGALIATVRRQEYASTFEPVPIGDPLPIKFIPKQSSTNFNPPLEEVLDRATWIGVDRHVNKNCHPPSVVWPFVSGDCRFSLTVDGKRLEYDNVRVAVFYVKDDQVYAKLILNGAMKDILVHNSIGRKYGSGANEGQWEAEDMSKYAAEERAVELNQQMYLEGYLSYHAAWSILYDRMQYGQAARLFVSTPSSGYKLRFTIPGFSFYQQSDVLSEDGKVEAVEIKFFRKMDVPLFDQEQIGLLERSPVSWHRDIALQLESNIWSYKFAAETFEKIEYNPGTERSYAEVTLKEKASKVFFY